MADKYLKERPVNPDNMIYTVVGTSGMDTGRTSILLKAEGLRKILEDAGPDDMIQFTRIKAVEVDEDADGIIKAERERSYSQWTVIPLNPAYGSKS